MFIKPKKRLGQHFLLNKDVQKNIIEAYGLKKSDVVLEIGAGRGELTKLIVEKVARIYALEIDSYLCNILRDNLKSYPNAVIINKDILKFDFKKYFKKMKDKIRIVGNIPYYITTPIIQYLIKYKDKIDSILITVQKEYARRVTTLCGTKDYGSFSCFMQYYTKPKIIFSIKRSCFKPSPKVDSCLLRLEMRDEPAVKVKNEKLLFKIIRAAFNQRRKTLRNSLEGIISKEKLKNFFIKYNINPDVRPEDLSLKNFADLIS